MGATSITTPEPGWRNGVQSIKAKLSYISSNPNCYQDVIFIVGREREQISAHKFILILGSSVFENLFLDSRSEYTVYNVEPAAFKCLLKFLYTDQLSISSEEALSAFDAAKKYEVSDLADRCIELVRSNITDKNVINILQKAKEFSEPELHNTAFRFILRNSEKIIRSPEFLRISYENLCTFLESDELVIDELSLFQAVLRWATEECKRFDLEESAENQRYALKKAIYLIRFPLISSENFTLHVLPTEILSQTEVIELFKFFTSAGRNTGSFSQQTFITRKRLGAASTASTANEPRFRVPPNSQPNRLVRESAIGDNSLSFSNSFEVNPNSRPQSSSLGGLSSLLSETLLQTKFSDLRQYRIMNVLDGKLLELDWNSSNGFFTKTWNVNDSPSQKWLATQGTEGFRLSTSSPPCGEPSGNSLNRVLEQHPDNSGRTNYNNSNSGINQQWYTETVGEHVMIKSSWNNRALKNNGIGHPVTCVELDVNDPSQQWRLQMIHN